jgi:hypothetical protein
MGKMCTWDLRLLQRHQKEGELQEDATRERLGRCEWFLGRTGKSEEPPLTCKELLLKYMGKKE